MAIPNISANTLVDQTLLNTMIQAINNNTQGLTQASSSIYNTATSSRVTSYIGAWTMCTEQVEVTDHNLLRNETSNKKVSITFGKQFGTIPLVFVTLQVASTTGSGASLTNILSSAVVGDVTTGGCNVYVNLRGNSNTTASTNFPYIVSVLAIGLNLIGQ